MRGAIQPEGAVFGRRLRELRRKRGLTQAALAELVGSTEPYMSNLETGVAVPSLTTILRLAVALKCKPSQLVTEFDTMDVAAVLPG